MRNEHSKAIYVGVWGSLVVLLIVTVAVSYVHFGRLNPFIAVAIAGVKATLIAVYFMHLRSSSKLVWIVATASVVWLAILFTLTTADYESRRLLPNPTLWQK